MLVRHAMKYFIETYGCQMNVHDSERIAGLLEASGYVRAEEGSGADVVVLNTCAVRENADNKLYGNLGHLASAKRARPGMQIAVGGCLAQKDRDGIVVRVIKYKLDDPQRVGHDEEHTLLTNLLDEKLYPARELICGYHERWEHELVYDEQKTHQNPRRATKPSSAPWSA